MGRKSRGKGQGKPAAPATGIAPDLAAKLSRRDIAAATDGSVQVEVTLGGVRKAAMLVHPDLVAYALRHGWRR